MENTLSGKAICLGSLWNWLHTHKQGAFVRAICGNKSKIDFQKLTLQIFSCLMNPVKYVHPAAFRRLLVLGHLTMKHTQLHQLPSLQHIGHSLTYLTISFSRHFKGDGAYSFTYLRKVKYLNMYGNGLIRTPLGLKFIARTVMTLDFEYNSIISLSSMEGIEFIKLFRLNFHYNNITHLHPELFITPHLKYLNLEGNRLISLAEVIQYSWGSSLPKHKYMAIALRQNPWHCNGSLTWMFSNLYKFTHEIIFAKPPFKPYIKNVEKLLCETPDARHGTTVVPIDVLERVNISIRSWRHLAGKRYCEFPSNISEITETYNQCAMVNKKRTNKPHTRSAVDYKEHMKTDFSARSKYLGQG